MGTWGMGAFDDDNALDWVSELTESRDGGLVRRALEKAAAAGPTDDLEAPDGQVALAAAEVVAAAAGRAADALPDEVRAWIATHGGDVANLTELAGRAVARVLAPESELRELWSTEDGAAAEDIAVWEANVRDLQRRLDAA